MVVKAFRKWTIKIIVGVFTSLLVISITSAKPQTSPFKVLGFSTTPANMADGGHRSFAKEANAWFPTVAAANGFIYENTTNWGDLNATKLANYKVIMFLDAFPWDAGQRTAFQNYMTNGGGFIGYHVSAFNNSIDPANWDWYTKTFLAMGQFVSNTWPPSGPLLLVEDTTHPAMKGLGASFKSPDNEFYSWQNDLRKNPDMKVLASIDKSAYPVGTQGVFTWSGTGYVPVIWTNTKYKMVYSNIGHNRADDVGVSTSFTNASFAKFVLNTIKWEAGVTTEVEQGKTISVVTESPKQELLVKTVGNDLEISLSSHEQMNATLCNALGITVASARSLNGIARIEYDKLKQGIYFIRVKNAKTVISQKICLENNTIK